jgi:hypothetical protein
MSSMYKDLYSIPLIGVGNPKLDPAFLYEFKMAQDFFDEKLKPVIC